jgi:V/A-type H+-transporting ATPase subunit C
MLALPDIPDLVAFLSDGPYGRAIESAGEAVPEGSRVEEGLRRDFSETMNRLYTMSGVEGREAVGILSGYLELQNLKTILRGKSAGLPADGIMPALIPAGFYDEAALRALSQQPDLKAVRDLLTAWGDPYGRPLADALKEYREPRDLFVLETALDRQYFDRSIRRVNEDRSMAGEEAPLSVFVALLIDRTNLMTALKAVEEGLALTDRLRYFLPGGRIYGEKEFVRLLSSRSLEEALRSAARSSFEAALNEPGAPPGRISTLSLVERRLDRVLLRKMRERMRLDPLGIAAVIRYLLDKRCEIMNLRMIWRGRLVALPEADLAALLTLEY